MEKVQNLESLNSTEPGVQELVSKLQELIAQTQKQPEYVLVEDAAKYLKVHRQTVYRYIAFGLLKAVKPRKHNYIKRSDLEAFVFNDVETPPPARLVKRGKGGGRID